MTNKTYRANFSTKNLQTAIHIATCRRVQTQRHSEVQYDIEASNAKEAAQISHSNADGDDRGLKFPRICECCGE